MAELKVMLVRGGTSKGAYLLASDLPQDDAARDDVLLRLMGSPDARQIDGLGGAHPLTSKVAIVSRSSLAGCDIDFLFAQVGVSEAKVDTTPNCGNILAGIGPFALARGLVAAKGEEARIKVRILNTGTRAELTLATENGLAKTHGEARIDGVPGTSAPILIDFLDAEGSVCGALLPTGRARDTILGVDCTLIDNGMPIVVMKASDFGLTGHETPANLDANLALKARIEAIRLEAGPMMNLGDVTQKVVPKMALVAPPNSDGHIATRCFIPHQCHASIGVFAAVTIATASALPGSPAAEVVVMPEGSVRAISVEHPSGEFTVTLTLGGTADAPRVERAGLLRTARILMDGVAYV